MCLAYTIMVCISSMSRARLVKESCCTKKKANQGACIARFIITHGTFKRTRSDSNGKANAVCTACSIMYGSMAARERLIFLPLSRVVVRAIFGSR